MTGDWWFGLATGFGVCLLLWWVKDAKLHRMRHSRNRTGLRRKETGREDTGDPPGR